MKDNSLRDVWRFPHRIEYADFAQLENVLQKAGTDDDENSAEYLHEILQDHGERFLYKGFEEGDLAFVKKVWSHLEKAGVDRSKYFPSQWSILDAAVSSGKTAVVTTLGEMAKEARVDIKAWLKSEGAKAIRSAAARGYDKAMAVIWSMAKKAGLDKVELQAMLAEKGSFRDINYCVLYLAAEKGHAESVMSILGMAQEVGVDQAKFNKTYLDAIRIAARNGYIDIVKILWTNAPNMGVDPKELITADQFEFLANVIRSGKLDLFDLALKMAKAEGIDLKSWFTPAIATGMLEHAVLHKHANRVSIIWEMAKEAGIDTKAWFTPIATEMLKLAVRRGDCDTVTVIWKKVKEVGIDQKAMLVEAGSEMLIKAVEGGNCDVVKRIYEMAKEEGVDIKALFVAKNYYIIQAALHSGNFDQISQVLEMAKEFGVEQEMFKARSDSAIQYLFVKNFNGPYRWNEEIIFQIEKGFHSVGKLLDLAPDHPTRIKILLGCMAIVTQEYYAIQYRLSETLLANILYYAEQIPLNVEQLMDQNRDSRGKILNKGFDILLRKYQFGKESPNVDKARTEFAKNVDNIKLLMAKGVTGEYHHVLEVTSAMLKPPFKLPASASPYAKACAEKGLLDTHQHQARNALEQDNLLLPPLINIVREYMSQEVELSPPDDSSRPFYPAPGLSQPIPYDSLIDNYIEAAEPASDKPITRGKEEGKESTAKNSPVQGPSSLRSSSYWTNSVSSSNTQAPLSSSFTTRISAGRSSIDSNQMESSAPPVSEERRQATFTIQQLCMGTDTPGPSTAAGQPIAGNQVAPVTPQPANSAVDESRASAVPTPVKPTGHRAAVEKARQVRKSACQRCVIL
jgi:hypothetical protein